ncbi:MAG: PepSY domain-containing protein [Comamonas sp.]|nr:PepSY domain-containing protein [Comamonas sp.]
MSLPLIHRFMRLVWLALLPWAAGLAHGAAQEQEAVRTGVASGQYQPLSAILSQVTARHGGRVLDIASKRGPFDELRYEIKLLDAQGHKQRLLVDAASGRTIEHRREDHAQAVSMTALAAYLAQLKLPAGQYISDVKFDRDSAGQGVYQIHVNTSYTPSTRLVMGAATGQLLAQSPHHAIASDGIQRIEHILPGLAPRFQGQVLEIELEHGKHHRPYYEIELLQGNGSTLELKIDAVTLELLSQKLED